MIRLYRAELDRFARWAAGLGLLHVAALLLLDRAFPSLRDDGEIVVFAGFVQAVAGAIFGVYQSASYARMGPWIALLHRPLAPWRIMAALFGASATLLFAAVAIPVLAFTAALTLEPGRVVDERHWQLAAAGFLIALVGFGVGSLLALAPRRYGWTGLVAASVLMVGSDATATGALLLPVVVVGVLALLLAGAFRPDRSRPPSPPGLLAVTAGVAALGVYVLLVGGTGLAYGLGLAAAGRNPEMDTPSPGGTVAATRARSEDLLAIALVAAPGPEAAALRRRLPGAASMRLPGAVDHMPMRGELANSGPIRFTDARTGIAWTYSHDRGAFLGLRLADRRPAGELRPRGGFPAPPRLTGDGSMIAGGDVYRLDAGSGRLERVLRLPAGETIMARPARAGPGIAVLGDRTLYFVAGDRLDAALAPRALLAIPLRGMVGDLHRIDVASLGDRTLVSLLFARDSVDGPHAAWQRLVSLRPDGTSSTLAERRLRPDYADPMRFRAYWLSPALHAAVAAARGIGSASAWNPRRAPVEVPRGVWIGAGLLSIAAAAATALLASRRRLRPPALAAWTLAALALGVPAFAAFWLIDPERT